MDEDKVRLNRVCVRELDERLDVLYSLQVWRLAQLLIAVPSDPDPWTPTGASLAALLTPQKAFLYLCKNILTHQNLSESDSIWDFLLWSCDSVDNDLSCLRLPFSASTSDVATFFAEYGVRCSQRNRVPHKHMLSSRERSSVLVLVMCSHFTIITAGKRGLRTCRPGGSLDTSQEFARCSFSGGHGWMFAHH